MRNQAPGAGDREVISWLLGEDRVLVTFDGEFAELARKAGLHEYCGVLLFKCPLVPPEPMCELLVEILTSRSDWAGHFSTVDEDHVHMVELSAPEGGEAGETPE